MAGNANASKGNPASHRMGNAHLKAYRASCRVIQERRKKKRQEANEAAHKHNLELRRQGKLTPWEEAKAARASRRASLRPVKTKS